MIKKLLATTAALGTVLGGAVAAAPAASASPVRPAAVLGCRAWTNPDANGVQLAPCFYIPDSDGSTIEGQVGVITHGRSIDPCEQLVNLDTGKWAVNYGCTGWVNTGEAQGWSAYLPAGLDLSAGHYVVQEGYWAYNASGNLVYYDNVQSPVINL